MSDRYDPMLAKLIVHGPEPLGCAGPPPGGARRDDHPRRAHQPALPALARRPAGPARRRDAHRHHRGARAALASRSRTTATGRRPRTPSSHRITAPGAGDGGSTHRRLGGSARTRRIAACRSPTVPMPPRGRRPFATAMSLMSTSMANRSTSRSRHRPRWRSRPAMRRPPPATAHRSCWLRCRDASSPCASPRAHRCKAHEAVVVIEAMKMEHAVLAPSDGVLASLHVHEGQQVQRGDLIGEVAPSQSARG